MFGVPRHNHLRVRPLLGSGVPQEYDGSLHPAADEIDAIRFLAPSDIPAAMRDAPFTEGFRRSFALWCAATQRARA